VRKKVDNKLTNSPYVSLLCDITTDILVAKRFFAFVFYGPYIFNMAPIFCYQWALGPLLFRSLAEHWLCTMF